jgi:autotransporter-associated beta strand protein
VVLATTGPAAAQTSGVWSDSSGSPYNWSNPANWGGSSFPDSGGTATFGGAAAANRTATLDVSATLGGLTFANTSNPFAYTITPAAAQTITFTAGAGLTNTAIGPNALGAGLALNGSLGITGSGFGNLTLGGAIADGSGSGSLLVNTTPKFSETGVVLLNGANTFTGGVTLQSGNLLLGNAAALGTGTLTVTGANTTLQGSGVTVANAIVLQGTGATGGAISFGGAANLTLSGVISNDTGNTGGVTNISRGGTLTLTGASTYTGATVATTNPYYVAVAGFNTPGGQNAIVFSGGGSALNTSAVTVTGGSSVILDNAGASPAIARIGSTTPVNLNNGTFRLNGSGAAGAFTQSAGTLTGTGYSTVVVNPAAGGGATTLNFASLDRGAAGTGTFLFVGGAGLGGGQANVTFTTPPISPTGLGTPAASIIPYAIGDGTVPGNGTNFVTYDTNGVRLLTAGELTGTLTAGQNVQLTAAATNSGTLSVNSLALSGGSAFAVTGGTLNVTSGAVLAVNTASTATTFTVGSNLAFGSTQANVFVPTGNAGGTNTLSLTGAVTGTGGLVKSGTGTLALPAGNTYSGGTTVNEGFITFTDPSAFGTGPITINSRQSAQAAGLTLTTPAAVTLNGVTVNTGSGAFNGPSSGLIVLAGTVSGTGSVTTSGGTLALTGTNTFTGTSRTNGGALFFASDANLGASPILTLSNASATNAIVLGGDWTTGKSILANPGSSSGFNTNGFNATTAGGSGVLLGSGALTKVGAGTLTLTNQNPYSGALTINNGTFALAGNGTLTGTNSITIASGGLSLDNTTTVVSNRLSTGATVTYFNGVGTLSINSGGGSVTQQLAGLTASGGSGMGAVRLDASAGGTVVVTAGAYTITGGNSPSLFVAGTNLGGTGPGSTQLIFTTLAPLAGSGAAGTHTVGVLRGGYGDTVATGSGSGLLTQTAAGTSVRLLNEATEYAVNAQEANANTLINGAAPTFTNANPINSLLLKNGNALTVTSGQTLTLTSGTIVSAGGTNALQGSGPNGGGATLASPAVSGIQSGFIFALSSDLTSTVVFNGAAAGSRLVKLGPGTLTLDPRDASGNVIAGTSGTVSDIRFYGGTVAVTNPNQTISAVGGGNLFFANDGKFRFAGVALGTSRTFNFLGSGGSLDLTGTAIQTNLTTAALTGPGALTLLGGTLALGSGSSSTPNPTQPNTITGGVILQGGTLALNANDSALLGTGPLTLSGGTLATRFADRTVTVPVFVGANTVLTNNLTISLPSAVPDASNASLTFAAPVRLNTSVILTQALTSTAAGNGNVTFASTIYENPFGPAQSLTFAGSGASPGRFILTAANTYTGGTAVTAGASVLANNTLGSATGTGAVTVGAGGRLGGTGFVVPTGTNGVTIGGTAGNNATLAPGSGTAPGTLSVGSAASPGKVTLNANSTLEVFLSTSGVSPAAPNTGGSSTGANNNLLAVLGSSGSLTIADPTTLTIRVVGDGTQFQSGQTYSFTVASAGTVSAVNITDPPRFDTSAFAGAPAGNFSLVGSGGSVYLNFTPVPEPAGLLLAGAAGVLTVGFMRRRPRRA